jgi:hypothetical protein
MTTHLAQLHNGINKYIHIVVDFPKSIFAGSSLIEIIGFGRQNQGHPRLTNWEN